MSTSEDRENAARLLHLFDAETLGDGNVDAGANVLAAMALTISNIQRPGSRMANQSGSITKLGCNLVASGGLSSGLIADLILRPLQKRQDNIFANVRHWEEHEKRRWEILVRNGREVDFDPEDEVPVAPVLANPDRNPILGEQEHTTRCLRLLVKPPDAGFHEICRHPMVVGIASSPDTLTGLMESAHLGRLFAHVALNEPADCLAYQKVATRLTGGCQLFKSGIRAVRGEWVVTDPGNALGEALSGGLAGTAWLGNAVWLSDHAAGPAFEPKAQEPTHAKIDQVNKRFLVALNASLAERLSMGLGAPTILTIEYRANQCHWVKFLLSLEPSFPGITGALRSLPASLYYGLLRIHTSYQHVENVPGFHLGLLYAFARMLALRMVNSRELMLRHGHQARIDSIAESVRRKLADGPLTVRELTRRSHRLPAADCEAALECLLLRGLVKRTDNAWALCETTASTQTQALTLNV